MFKTVLPVLVVTFLALSGPAFGHAKLQSSTPVAEAKLMEAPKLLVLNFNEDVQLAALKLASPSSVVPIEIDRSAKATSKITIALPPLAAGKYTVTWSALSPGDGHIMKGAFSFTIMGPM